MIQSMVLMYSVYRSITTYYWIRSLPPFNRGQEDTNPVIADNEDLGME